MLLNSVYWLKKRGQFIKSINKKILRHDRIFSKDMILDLKFIFIAIIRDWVVMFHDCKTPKKEQFQWNRNVA